MKIRPLSDHLLISRQDAEAQTASGLFIPETAKEKPARGIVIAAGPGKRGKKGEVQPLQVKSGDAVLFGKWSGTDIELSGEKYLLLRESDVLGIVEG